MPLISGDIRTHELSADSRWPELCREQIADTILIAEGYVAAFEGVVPGETFDPSFSYGF